jgi:hypothetical protein
MDFDERFPGVLIKGGRCRLALRPTGEPEEYGIPTEIDIVAGPFSGVFRDRFVGSFQRFTDQIESLHKELRGTAELGSLEGHLSLKFQAETLGHIAVKGKIVAEHLPRIALSFEFSIDQSYLPRIAQDARRYFVADNV